MTRSYFSLTIVLSLLIVSGSLIHPANAQPMGVLKGLVVDSETGEPLPGAVVMVEASSFGTMVGVDGRYTLMAPVGVHTIRSELIGYSTLTVTEVEIPQGKPGELNLTLTQEVIALDMQIVVTAEAVQSAEAGLLKIQQKSDKVTDGISAELISKTSSSDAGDALKRVTGVTMVGKHTYVRGLGGRYSNTLLNGAKVPSPEPNRVVVPMDMFPANLLDHVQIAKTFTPDLPGDFAGGSVQIVAKEFPENLTLSFSTSAGYNSQSTFQDIRTYTGGNTDFIGVDDGTRALPDIIQENAGDQRVISKGGNAGPDDPGFYRDELEQFGEAFKNIWSPKETNAPLNHGYSFSLGNEVTLGGERKFGYVVALNYSNNHSFTEEKRRVFTVGSNDQLNTKVDYDVESSVNDILWGGVLNGSLRLSAFHNIALKSMYNRSAEDEARIFTGLNDDRQKYWRDYRLRYIERGLLSNQFQGKHYLYNFLDSDLEWKLTYANVKRNEPDNREVIYERSDEDSAWELFVNNSQSGSRHFYDLDEDEFSASIDWSIPFRAPVGLASKIKVGGLYSQKDRTFEVRRLRFLKLLPADIPWPPPADFFIDVTAPPEELFTPENISSDIDVDRFEITESTNYEDGYTADHEITAAYATLDMYITEIIRFVGGARYERAKQNLELSNPLGLPYNPGIGDTTASLDNEDILPCANLVYALTDKSNIRLGYGRTLARPDFRELAPYEFINYVGGYAEKGNPKLKRTLIDNFDLRVERFPRPGELLAFSVFYKKFTDPIEQVIQPTAQLRISYDNAESAESYGFEVEVRKALDFLAEELKNFSVNTNFTFMETEVTIPEKAGQVQTSSNRSLQGQSPYVVNVMLAYDDLNRGTSSSLMFHQFGRRLTDVGGQGNPDTYEESRPVMDFSFKQRLISHLSLKLVAKNIFDPDYEWTQKGETRIKYKKGRSITLGFTYSL